VWSAWPESLDLYLGQGLAMLGGTGSSQAMTLRHAPTMPLEQRLGQVAQALISQAKHSTTKARRLRVALSGALCPAIALRQYAKATAAAVALGMDAQTILCEMDSGQSGLAAAIPVQLGAELQRWAKAQGLRISSMQPLWAMATQCKAAMGRSVRGLLLHEEDALTMLAQPPTQERGNVQGAQTAAFSLAGAFDAADPPVEARRWLVGQGLAQEQLLRLSFGEQARSRLPDGPQPWAMHWSRP
jgi:hypothetical protein